MATFVGIDLGTTNSVVAYRNAYGRPEVIAEPRRAEYHAFGDLLRLRPAGGRPGGQGVGAAGQ